MRIVITGAGGLVGSSLNRRLCREHEILALTHRDLDITDESVVLRQIAGARPDVIFNCAVIGVDECERDPELARHVNVDGPRHLASAANRSGATLIHFSTNYVFGGTRGEGLYTTHDTPDAVNTYGATKAEGERAVLSACGTAFVIRTSWVFGKGKKSFLSTAGRKLAAGERVRAIVDVFASCTYVEDLTSAVVSLAQTRAFGLHQIVNSGVCSYADFALEAARIVGASESLIERTTAADAYREAARPRYTPMESTVPLREWRGALGEYLRT